MQDGRLRESDRLVRLNGVSLIGRSNSHAMSTVREVLRCRGTVAGYVDLVVARQRSFQPTLTHCCSSEVLSDTPPPSLERPRSGSDKPKPSTKPIPNASSPVKPSTKVVLRNMSYQLANGDSFVSDTSGLSVPRTSRSLAPTINGGHYDTVLIETDASQPPTVSSLSTC